MADPATSKAAVFSKEEALRDNLRMELVALIKKPSNSKVDAQPPFSTQELIIMALIISQKPLLPIEIMGWILRNVRYYNNLAISQYVTGRMLSEALVDHSELLPDFYTAFNDWRAPIYSASKEEVVTSYSARRLGFRITTTVEDSRFFLRRWLAPIPRKQSGETALLLKLPAEIRMMIFEMALSFPHPGVFVRKDGFRLFRRDNDYVLPGLHRDLLRIPRHAFALFLVNQEILGEALSSFYSKNTFVFNSVWDLAKFTDRLSPERLQLLKNIFVQYPSFPRNKESNKNLPFHYQQGAKMLSKLRDLRCLELEITDAAWVSRPGEIVPWGDLAISDPSKLPGIQYIAFALTKAQAFKISGDCPIIKAYLEKEAERLRRAEEDPEVDRLTKAEKLREAQSFKEVGGPTCMEKSKAPKRRSAIRPSEEEEEEEGRKSICSTKPRGAKDAGPAQQSPEAKTQKSPAKARGRASNSGVSSGKGYSESGRSDTGSTGRGRKTRSHPSDTGSSYSNGRSSKRARLSGPPTR